MTKKQTFTGVIQNAGGGGAFVEVPFDVEAAFGSKRPKIKAVRMGGPNHMLIILKGIREQIGKTFGDEIKISVEADVEERVVTLPAELKWVFKSDKVAQSAFEKLSYTHQKEYVKWIEDAKKDETRQSRIVKTIEMLKNGKKTI